MAKKFNLVFITSFSAVLVLIWDHLLYFQRGIGIGYFLQSDPHIKRIFDFGSFFFYFFPFFGLLADVCIGTYKAILTGMILCFTSWIISGFGFIVIQSYGSNKALHWSVYSIVYLTQHTGIAFFIANIIQYIIDQLVGASSDELNTVIYWHCAALPIQFLLFSFADCFDTYKYINLIMFILSGVSASLVLVSHSFFKHKLENISLIKNPIKLIVRVLCYARKHKYPENRSALTYWEEEAPSRIDLGKDKYGGPFTVEEVEDVKTFFRMIPLFIAIIGYSLSREYYYNFPNNDASFLICLLSNDAVHVTSSFLLIMIYLYTLLGFFSTDIFLVCYVGWALDFALLWFH